MPSPATWSDDERRRFLDDGVLIRRGLVHASSCPGPVASSAAG
ncbi:hypothetical protein [Streptomyces sp. NPDC007984]